MAAFPAVPLLPDPFRAAGYATGMVGKWHVSFLPGSRPLDRGFERFFGFLGGEHDYFLPNVGQATHGIAGSTDAFVLDQEKPAVEIGYLTDEFTTRAIGFIDEARAAAKPFLLYLAYNSPHTPLQVPETVTGLDWLPHVTAERRPWPERSLHWSTAVKKARWAVRAGRWKLVNEDTRPGIGAWPLKESPKGDRVKPAVEVQLYDLDADPAERRDLAAAEPEVVARLRADIDGFLAGLPPSLATPEVLTRSKAIQREREADPTRYPTAPRRDGAPGHWRNAGPADAAVPEPAGITTPRVESFPREGRGYQLVDWRRRTEAFLDVVLDPPYCGGLDP